MVEQVRSVSTGADSDLETPRVGQLPDVNVFLKKSGVRTATRVLVATALLATILAGSGRAGDGTVTSCEALLSVPVFCAPQENLGGYALYSTTGGEVKTFPDGRKGVGWSYLQRTPKADASCVGRPKGAQFAFVGGARVCPKGVAPTQ